MFHKFIPLAAAAIVAAPAFGGTTIINGNTVASGQIDTNTTWGGPTFPSPIFLDDAVYVDSGATLTILPGTVIYGQPRTDLPANAPSGNPGSLTITRTGMIDAQGTPTDPIIFTSAAIDADGDNDPDEAGGFLVRFDYTNDALADIYDDAPKTAPVAPLASDGEANVQLWGGVIILGNAPTNLGVGGPAYGEAEVEGLVTPQFPVSAATYGGVIPHDNSGIVRYVILRYGGDEIGTANEINGFTLGAVGSGTTFEFNEVFMNFDDGFEWFGGTVNTNNLVATFIGDDAYDLDQGFTGKGQFWFATQAFFDQASPATGSWGGGSAGDEAGEWDGDDSDFINYRVDTEGPDNNTLSPDETPFPLSYPAVYNMTVVGSTFGSGADFAQTNGDTGRILMRNGFAGELWNSIIVNTGSANGLSVASGGVVHGFDSVSNADASNPQGLPLITVGGTLFDDVPASTATDVGNVDALANGDAAVSGTFEVNFVNTFLAGGFPGLLNEDQSFDPQGNAANKLDSTLKSTPFNPRPGPTPLTTPAPFVNGFEVVTYRGAFDPDTGIDLWTTGWTTLNVAGLLAD
jgi:hypothetical protein